jgi:hypothetical protein
VIYENIGDFTGYMYFRKEELPDDIKEWYC